MSLLISTSSQRSARRTVISRACTISDSASSSCSAMRASCWREAARAAPSAPSSMRSLRIFDSSIGCSGESSTGDELPGPRRAPPGIGTGALRLASR
ncbi:hypothetical protein BEN78_14425 [Xanthomonas citri pv. mangiferaeindicae]|nr:hypothetical protein BEN78_14425 [Xanthomonas citri pv. mangiferaeindicae]